MLAIDLDHSSSSSGTFTYKKSCDFTNPQPTDKALYMCGRHPNRLVWRDQAFKIEQYFQTHYLLFNGIELCHKHTSPVYFNGLGSANVQQQAVSKVQCGARLYDLKTFITAVANLENNECLCEFSYSYACVYVTRHISFLSSILLPWQTWLQIFFSLFTVITLFQASK